MKLIVLTSYLLGVFTGWFSKECTLIRQVQKQRYWFGEHEDT